MVVWVFVGWKAGGGDVGVGVVAAVVSYRQRLGIGARMLGSVGFSDVLVLRVRK